MFSPQELPIAYRQATKDDYGFILSTWTQSHHKTQPINFIPNEIYFPYQTKLINHILTIANSLIICIDDEPNTILGYIVFENYSPTSLIIHFAHVKSIYRRLGVFNSALSTIKLPTQTIINTHYFDLFKKFKDKYQLTFDPTYLDRYNAL